jgi:hypothetical protein
MIRLALHAPLIRCLLRLLVAAHTLPSRHVTLVILAQASGLTDTPYAVASPTARNPFHRAALEAFRADAILLRLAAQQFEYGGHAFCYHPRRGSQMANLSGVVAHLKMERERVHKEVERIDAALAAQRGREAGRFDRASKITTKE